MSERKNPYLKLLSWRIPLNTIFCCPLNVNFSVHISVPTNVVFGTFGEYFMIFANNECTEYFIREYRIIFELSKVQTNVKKNIRRMHIRRIHSRMCTLKFTKIEKIIRFCETEALPFNNVFNSYNFYLVIYIYIQKL